jgi:thiol-disulfide isomerase/thioredoxin
MQTLPLGPLALSVAGLLVFAGLATAIALGGWLHRRGRPSPEHALWWLLALAVLVARAAFVVRWWPHYAEHPLGVLDLRDGGFLPWTGVAALVIGALWIGWRQRPLREALAWSVLGGLLVWGFGNLVVWRLADAAQRPLPALIMRDLEDRPVPLQELRGRPLVINLWASWCGPCRREMPVLARAQQAQTVVRFAFADQGESPAQIREFLGAQGLRLEGVLADQDSQLSQHFGVRGYPTTLFFDARGSLRSVHTGELSRATLAAELRHISPGASSRAPLSPPGASP